MTLTLPLLLTMSFVNVVTGARVRADKGLQTDDACDDRGEEHADLFNACTKTKFQKKIAGDYQTLSWHLPKKRMSLIIVQYE